MFNTFFLNRAFSAGPANHKSTIPSKQSSQRHTSSPNTMELNDPRLDTESNESLRNNLLGSLDEPPAWAAAASIFFANSTSISVLGRDGDDE